MLRIVGRGLVLFAVALLYAVMLAGCAAEGTTRILSYYGDWTGVLGCCRPAPHGGIDVDAAKGDPVIAAADGVVTGFIEGNGCAILGHRMGDTFSWWTLYCHMDEIDVKPGQEVKRGEVLGKAGTTGMARGVPHVHFELRQGQPGRRVDPLPFIVGCFDPVKTYSAPDEGNPRLVLTYPVRCARTQWGK